MSMTDKTSVMAKYIFDQLTANMTSLGLKAVYYGNQTMIPVSPVVTVTPGIKRRDLAGVAAPGGRTTNSLSVAINVLASKVGEESVERLKLDDLADTVEKFIHQDVTLGGLIIHGFIGIWNPDEVPLQNGQFRLVSMTFTGISKTYLSGA